MKTEEFYELVVCVAELEAGAVCYSYRNIRHCRSLQKKGLLELATVGALDRYVPTIKGRLVVALLQGQVDSMLATMDASGVSNLLQQMGKWKL